MDDDLIKIIKDMITPLEILESVMDEMEADIWRIETAISLHGIN